MDSKNIAINIVTLLSIAILWLKFILEVHQLSKMDYRDVIGMSPLVVSIHLLPLMIVSYFIIVRLGV